VAKYPKAIRDEMLRIGLVWEPYTDKDGDRVRALPLFLTVPETKQGVVKPVSVRPQEANSFQLERALAHYRRMADQCLRRYRERRSQQMAKQTAEQMMLANLACQLFNQYFGEDESKDAPFPVTG
jgi:hypothetical protein